MQYAPVEKHKDIMKALERLKQAGGKVFDFHASSTIMPFHPQPQVLLVGTHALMSSIVVTG